MAAVARQETARRAQGHLRPIRPVRDLADIADLTEIGFGDQLGRGGREIVREMRELASLGPLLWPAAWALKLSMGAGFVWEEGGKVVGNVSLFDAGRFPGMGRGWLIANVVVHPAHRQRGIARALVGAALADARARGGRWVALQVERDNDGARALYESLGFEDKGVLVRWEADFIGQLPLTPLRWRPHRPRPNEARQEAAIVQQTRPAMIIWSRVLTPGDVGGGWLHRLEMAFTGVPYERCVIGDAENGLRGVAWIEGYRERRISLFYPFPLRHEEERRALAHFTLRRAMDSGGGYTMVEYAGEDPVIEDLLRGVGFRLQRELVQMRHSLDLD